MNLELSSWRSLGGAMFVVMGQDDPVSPEPVPVTDIPSHDKAFPWPYFPASRQQKAVFIRDLGNPRLSVTAPIPVSIEVADGQVTACCYDIEQFGAGESEFAALDDLRATIVELYDTLKEERNLGPLPRRQLAYLEQALKEA